MQVDVAPTPGKCKLLRRCEVLVADCDHKIVEQGCSDFGQHFFRNVLRKVNASHFGS